MKYFISFVQTRYEMALKNESIITLSIRLSVMMTQTNMHFVIIKFTLG